MRVPATVCPKGIVLGQVTWIWIGMQRWALRTLPLPPWRDRLATPSPIADSGRLIALAARIALAAGLAPAIFCESGRGSAAAPFAASLAPAAAASAAR